MGVACRSGGTPPAKTDRPIPRHIPLKLKTSDAPVAGDGRTGNLTGLVKDDLGGRNLPGVTVTARSLRDGSTEAVLTETSGQYLITNLAPGPYEVTFVYGVAKVTRGPVTVSSGRTSVANARVSSDQDESPAPVPLREPSRP